MRVQEMLQVENVFNLQVIGEGDDTQLNLEWITLDEKKNETDVCLGCGTFQLNDKVMGLVEKLVGVKVFEKPVVVEKRIEPVVKVGKRKKGILFDIGVDEWKWIVNGDEKTDGKYEGEIKNGKPDGKGYFSKPKWGSFDGRWSDGNPSQGTEKWYNGNEYSGEYNKNGIHGQGTFTWSDGGKYVGEWKDDKRTGQGTFTYPNGGKYIGEFKDNKMNGQGTFTTSDGDSFRGSWKDDNLHEGVFKSSEGSIFSGEMRHQLPWNGIQYDKNGNFVRRFKNGKKGY
jgi:hypothetical protein